MPGAGSNYYDYPDPQSAQSLPLISVAGVTYGFDYGYSYGYDGYGYGYGMGGYGVGIGFGFGLGGMAAEGAVESAPWAALQLEPAKK